MGHLVFDSSLIGRCVLSDYRQAFFDSIFLTFRPAFNLRTFKAEGITIFFFLSYGGGTPSNVCSRFNASLPRSVLWAIIPRTVRQKILEGARK